MMNRKGSLYAVIGGCVGAVLTMAICSVMPIGAQNGDTTFGEIICTDLKVVDDAGTSRVTLSATEDTGGRVMIGVKDEAQVALYASEDSAAVSVENEVWEAALGVAEDSGVAVYGKGDYMPRASIHVDSLGNGTVATWDKNGDRLATLGR